MDERRCQFWGLIGFVLSGLIFMGAGTRHSDPFIIAGAIVWTVACAIWLIPFFRKE